MNQKPTTQSTEFILSVISLLGGVALIIFGVLKGQQQLVDTGLWLALGSSGSYTLSRGLAKFGAGASQPTPAASTPPPVDDKAAADAVAKVP